MFVWFGLVLFSTLNIFFQCLLVPKVLKRSQPLILSLPLYLWYASLFLNAFNIVPLSFWLSAFDYGMFRNNFLVFILQEVCWDPWIYKIMISTKFILSNRYFFLFSLFSVLRFPYTYVGPPHIVHRSLKFRSLIFNTCSVFLSHFYFLLVIFINPSSSLFILLQKCCCTQLANFDFSIELFAPRLFIVCFPILSLSIHSLLAYFLQLFKCILF